MSEYGAGQEMTADANVKQQTRMSDLVEQFQNCNQRLRGQEQRLGGLLTRLAGSQPPKEVGDTAIPEPGNDVARLQEQINNYRGCTNEIQSLIDSLSEIS